MELPIKQLCRIAGIIHERLQLIQVNRFRHLEKLLQVITRPLDTLDRIDASLKIVRDRNWRASGQVLANRIHYTIRDLPYAISDLEHFLNEQNSQPLSQRQIYEELRQIQQEFGRLVFEKESLTLSVFTQPLRLEDIFLGDFEIRLYLDRLSDLSNQRHLRIVALDPHPASSNDSVTHPHVSDEYLCAGDAQVPMNRALAQGRICDFFLLINGVLENYNPSSPYVSLDDWEGVSCFSCGDTVHHDELSYCERCDESFCESCIGYCSNCEASYCYGCLRECSVCHEFRCKECISHCSSCGEPVCQSCLEDEMCPTCKEESEVSDAEEYESAHSDAPTTTEA